MLNLNLLTCETLSNKIPNVSLHPALVILVTKITIHLRTTWMHNKTRTMEFLKDLLSQFCQLGNHNPSPIPKTTIRVNGVTPLSRGSRGQPVNLRKPVDIGCPDITLICLNISRPIHAYLIHKYIKIYDRLFNQ